MALSFTTQELEDSYNSHIESLTTAQAEGDQADIFRYAILAQKDLLRSDHRHDENIVEIERLAGIAFAAKGVKTR